MYTPASLTAVIETGYAARGAIMVAGLESIGATVESLHIMDGTKWDFMMVVDYESDDVIFSAMKQAQASGAFGEVEIHWIRTPEEADATQVSMDWRPPASS